MLPVTAGLTSITSIAVGFRITSTDLTWPFLERYMASESVLRTCRQEIMPSTEERLSIEALNISTNVLIT